MNKAIISTNEAPKAIGPYSQAVKANGFLFASGQIPIDPVTGEIVYGGVVSQTHQVCANLRAILAAEKLSFNDVVKTTVFLSDMDNFHAMNEVYSQYFGEQPPARACVQVAKLPRDVSVEIEAIAAYPAD